MKNDKRLAYCLIIKIYYHMKKNKKDWLGLIFVEVYAVCVLIASVLGLFYAELPEGSSNLFFLPLMWWLKIIFISLAVLCGWLLYWVPKNWFKH